MWFVCYNKFLSEQNRIKALHNDVSNVTRTYWRAILQRSFHPCRTTLMRKRLSRTLTISLIYQQSAVFHHKTVYVWQRLVVICKRRLDRISREIKIMNWKTKCCPVVYQISTFFKQKKWKRIRYKKIGFSFRSH